MNTEAIRQGFWGPGEQGHLFQEQVNKDLKLMGTGELRQFWETRNIYEIKILILGNREAERFISRKQWNRYTTHWVGLNLNGTRAFISGTMEQRSEGNRGTKAILGNKKHMKPRL